MNTSRTGARSIIAFAKRLIALTFPMLLAVASLAVVEAIALWLAGVTYTPKSHINSIGVLDFCLVGEKRLGLSRVYFRRADVNQSCEWEILLHDMQRPEMARRLHATSLKPQVISAAQDGRRLAIGGHNGVIHIWDGLQANSPPRMFVDARGDTVSMLAHSPDGEWLFAAGHSVLYGWKIASEKLVHRVPHRGGGKCSLSFSKDSTKMMFVGWDSRVRVMDLKTGASLEEMALSTPAVFSASLSPNGKIVAAVNVVGYVTVVDLECQAELWRTIVRDASPIAFSNDGERIAFVDKAGRHQFIIQVCQTRTGQILHEFVAHDSIVPGLVFAHDGSLISWDLEGHIRKWDLATQKITWNFSARDWCSNSQAFANKLRPHPLLGTPGKRF